MGTVDPCHMCGIECVWVWYWVCVSVVFSGLEYSYRSGQSSWEYLPQLCYPGLLTPTWVCLVPTVLHTLTISAAPNVENHLPLLHGLRIQETQHMQHRTVSKDPCHMCGIECVWVWYWVCVSVVTGVIVITTLLTPTRPIKEHRIESGHPGITLSAGSKYFFSSLFSTEFLEL